MTSILSIILLSLMGVCPTATRAINGSAMFLTHGDIAPNLQRNAVPCTNIGCKWPKYGKNVIVPVRLSSHFTNAERLLIIDALLSFHQKTCIQFVWHTKQRDYVHFVLGPGCTSPLGRQSGEQYISLGRNGCMRKGVVQHEILHTLGFHHEQVRFDRDDYVHIFFENIEPGMETNFYKVNTNNLGTPYDFDSIMHYGNFGFSKNGLPTIISKMYPVHPLGTSLKMTDNDIKRVNALYECAMFLVHCDIAHASMCPSLCPINTREAVILEYELHVFGVQNTKP
ncbi:hatching enzyme 1.2-like [Stigmatopora nigra]